MEAPGTRNWNAWLDLMPGSSSRPMLHVTGEVETAAGNLVPRLAHGPQGDDPAILILDLAIAEEGDAGTADVAYRPARHSEPASRGRLTDVQVRWEGGIIAETPVEEVDGQPR